ncbi:MAG: hypothetical protein JST01_00730 [Cyanobacteria bacterium SZAS TMP-1]|nr:hypothetical protein [Cyanobacteria bacterium SZAS TMP-1]
MSSLKSKKVALWAITGIAVVSLIWLFTHLPVTGSVDVHWPTKSQTHTLLLRPAGSSESTRLIDYAPDQTTITGMRIEYRDGRTALVSYQGGKPAAMQEYFPDPTATGQADDTAKLATSLKKLSDGLSARQLSSKIEFKKDGWTIKTITTYSMDGNYASVAVRDAADDFVLTVYGANGATGVASVAVYDGKSGALKSRQDFNPDGTVAASFTATNAWGGAKQVYFDSIGNKSREILYNSRYDVAIKEYAPDGKTLVKMTSYGYYGVTVTEYDSTGTKAVIERNFNDDSSRISVRYFDSRGTATMKQIWVKLDSATMPADRVEVVNDGYVIQEVYEYHTDGSSTKVDVTFYPGGKVVREYETRPTTDYRPSKDQFFREDGSLDHTNDCLAGTWTCNTTTMPAGPNVIRPRVPVGYYKVVPLLPLPSLEKPQVPTMKVNLDLR